MNTNVRRSPVRKLFSVLSLIAALFAVGAVHAASPTQVEGTTTVDAATAKQLFDRGVPFVDVRGSSYKDGPFLARSTSIGLGDSAKPSLLTSQRKSERSSFTAAGIRVTVHPTPVRRRYLGAIRKCTTSEMGIQAGRPRDISSSSSGTGTESQPGTDLILTRDSLLVFNRYLFARHYRS